MDLPTLTHWLSFNEMAALLEHPDEGFDDPVVQGEDGNYYFWDEMWAEAYGPYESEEEARKACKRYASTLWPRLTGPAQ